MSFFLFSIPQIFLTAVKDIAYFPVWWYTRGTVDMVVGSGRMLAGQAKGLAIGVWVMHIFTPMYGQYDWQGRIISFFMRFVQIILRSIALVAWGIFALAVILFWLLMPPALVVILMLQF